jgi:hypothetical protein
MARGEVPSTGDEGRAWGAPFKQRAGHTLGGSGILHRRSSGRRLLVRRRRGSARRRRTAGDRCGKRDGWCCRRVDPGDAVEMCVQGWWWRRGCEVRRLRSVERRRSICGATGGRQRGEDAHPGVVMEEGFRGGAAGAGSGDARRGGGASEGVVQSFYPWRRGDLRITRCEERRRDKVAHCHASRARGGGWSVRSPGGT